MAGVYTDQRLNLSKLWEGPRKKCRGFKPDPGNLAVRDYRGGFGKRTPWWDWEPVLQSKEQERKPPTYSGARPISIPVEKVPLNGGVPPGHRPDIERGNGYDHGEREGRRQTMRREGHAGSNAAKLAAVPVGESPTGGDCPVDTVVIPGGEKGDRLVGSPGVKVSKGGEQLDRS